MSRVSLIATVYNEADSMGRFVQSILSQTRLPDEVVIVDGGSTDGTPEVIAREFGDRLPLNLIVEAGLNISEGRNLAIREAAYSLIACSDAGSVLRPDWLEKIIEPLETDSSVDVASGFYSLECHSLLQTCVGLATMPGQLDPPDPDKFLPSARSIAFRKSVWEAAGGYPEWLYAGEDTLFDEKLKKMGYRFQFVGEAIVEWEPRRTWRSVFKQFYIYAIGGGRMGGSWKYLLWELKQILALVAIGIGTVFYPLTAFLFPVWLGYNHFLNIHRKARRIASRCGSIRAYWVTGLVYWVIRVARLFGYSRGRWERHNDKPRYVDQMDEYMNVTPGDRH